MAATISAVSTRDIAKRWRNQYQKEDGTWKEMLSGDSKVIYDALRALGPMPKIEDVNAVIGNKSWTTLTCDGCEESVEVGVCFDENFLLCKECLQEALQVLEAASRS